MAARDIRTASQSQVSIFHQVSGILSSDLSLDEMLGEVIGLAVRTISCDACLVYLIDHDSNEIVLRASQVPHAGALGMLRLKIGEGVTGWVAEHFHQVSGILSSDLLLDEMLGEVIGLAVRATACDACLVYLIDHDSNEIVVRASQVPHAGALGMLRLKIGEGVTGWVAEQRSVVALPENASSDARFKRLQGLVEDTYEAFLSVPIVSGGELIGVVNVHHRMRHDH